MRACGALLLELVGARSAAPAALLPIEENRKVRMLYVGRLHNGTQES